MWFELLFGFAEMDPDSTRARFELKGEQLRSRVNGAVYGVGRFSTPSLAELREAAAPLPRDRPNEVTHEAVMDVLELHAMPENRGALFQVASQLNCLEFPGPSTTPEDGVTGYEADPTQGPACALAAAAATVYRHLFVPVGNGFGQARDRQIDNLADLERVLCPLVPLWEVRNGYTFSTAANLNRLNDRLTGSDPDALMSALRIGLQSGVEVTFSRRFHRAEGAPRVSQAFCSALSCSYSGLPNSLWGPFARLVLDASYEATLLAAALDREAGRGNGRVWLTFLGGGAFGNEPAWITAAMGRALRRAAGLGLDIRVAHYRSVRAEIARAVEEASRRA